MLPKFVSLHQAFVQPKDDNWLDLGIGLDPKLSSFTGCIGSLDGTFIHTYIPAHLQSRWHNRKGFISQNVFAALRSDGAFSYILAGAEGSTHDSTLCRFALTKGFRIPPGRFYLGDLAFGGHQGIVIPYSGIRYHLEEWRKADNRPVTAKELYNLRHATARNVVERVFRVVKKKWKIIKHSAPEYSISAQVRILYAVTGLYNFMLEYKGEEDSLLASQEERSYAKGSGIC